MALRIGDTAPNFQADTTEGRIDFHQWLGNGWGILFSHPADYTPVCTTELGAVAKLKDQFAKRNVKCIAVSVDPVDAHNGWVRDINETQGVTMQSWPSCQSAGVATLNLAESWSESTTRRISAKLRPQDIG